MDNIINNPEWLAYSLNFDSEEIDFIEVSQKSLRSVAWLRKNAFPADVAKCAIPLSQLQNHTANEAIKPMSFIFHTAYCGSTFASRCLDFPGKTLALREPQLLLDAANAKRIGWRAKSVNMDYRHLIRIALNLLTKHSDANEHTVIKPINSVNNVAIELLSHAPNSRALMLYTDARNFLLSTLKKGEAARQTTRAMFDLVRCDFPHLSQLQLSSAIHMSDLKLILTLWRLQLEQANVILNTVGQSRIRSLHAEQLVNFAAQSMDVSNTFLGLELAKEELAQNLNRLAGYDAKNTDQEFSVNKRAQQYSEIEKFYGSDLTAIYAWLQANNPNTALDPSLSSPLL